MRRRINQEFSGWDPLPVSVCSSCGLDPCQRFKNANVSCTIKSSFNVSMRILAVTVNATEVLSGNAELTTHTLLTEAVDLYINNQKQISTKSHVESSDVKKRRESK